MSRNMELNTVKNINENLKKRNISVEELVNVKFDIIKKNENNLKIFITEDYENSIKKAKELDAKNVFSLMVKFCNHLILYLFRPLSQKIIS